MKNSSKSNYLANKKYSNKFFIYAVFNKKIIFHFLILLITATFNQEVYAQQSEIKVSGIVYDSKKITVPGVTVTVENTQKGTITDGNGRFSLSVPEGAALIFSAITFKTQKLIAKSEPMQVILIDEQKSLDEVVVIGYQTTTRRSVSSSIASVKADDIKSTVTGNAIESIQGKLPGVQITQGGGGPGSQPKILVGGLTTLTGSSDPLIVVDGNIIGFGGLNSINPSDIASIDVLKDASAAAIYGARAGQGVVLVTTKRGNGKPSITLNSVYGLENLKKPNLAGSEEYTRVINQVASLSGQPAPFNGSQAIDTDWWDLVFDNGTRSNYNLNITGGSANGLNYFSSVGYYRNDSYYTSDKGGKWERYSLRLNTDYKISDAIKVGVDLSPRFERRRANTNQINTTLYIAPNVSPFKSEDQVLADLEKNQPSWNYTAFNPEYSQYNRSDFNNITNPLSSISRNFNQSDQFGLQYLGYFQLSPLKNLIVKTSFGGFFENQSSSNYLPKYWLGNQDFASESNVSQTQNSAIRWQWNNTLDYTLKFLEKHNLNVLLGQSIENYTFRQTFAQRKDIPSDNEPFQTVGSGTTIVDGNGSFQPGAGPFGKLSSFFGRIQYNFKNRYYLSASARADGSSMFADGNKWGYFPTISGHWIASDETFFKGIESLNLLKIRASYGRSGSNIPGTVGSYLATLSPSYYTDANGNLIVGYSPSNVPDPNISWESTEDVTVGFESAFFNNRLNISAERYWRSPDNLLLNLPIQPSLGFPQGYIPTIYTNIGSLQTKGWDANLSWNDKIGNFSYGASLNVTHFRSKAEDLRGEIIRDDIPNDQFAGTFRTRTVEGGNVGAFYGYQVSGIFQTQDEVNNYRGSNGNLLQPQAKPGDFIYANTNNDNILDANDFQELGNPYPNLSGGLTFTAGFKNFDFRTEFYGSFGQDIFDNYLASFRGSNRFNFFEGWGDRYWTGSGTTNEYPRLSTSADANGNFTKTSSFFIKDASFVRCRVLQLGYTIPSKYVKFLKNIRFFASGQNLFTLTNYEGLNPEVPFGGIIRNGIDNGQNPIARTYLFGIDLTF